MEKNKRLIINVLLVAILVVIAIGRSYSYLSVNDSSNAKPENLILQNGDIDIAFSGSNTIEFSSPKAKNKTTGERRLPRARSMPRRRADWTRPRGSS